MDMLSNRGFSKHRLKSRLRKFLVNYYDVLVIRYSMVDINEYIASHFS